MEERIISDVQLRHPAHLDRLRLERERAQAEVVQVAENSGPVEIKDNP